jgi:hypothetical protein
VRKYLVKNVVLWDLLKVFVSVRPRIWAWREFHNVTAGTLGLRSPWIPLAFGIEMTRGSFEDQSLRPGTCRLRSSLTYSGLSVWCMTLCVRRTQYSMRDLTGSQWRSLKIGVMWSLFHFFVRSLAAAFEILRVLCTLVDEYLTHEKVSTWSVERSRRRCHFRMNGLTANGKTISAHLFRKREDNNPVFLVASRKLNRAGG